MLDNGEVYKKAAKTKHLAAQAKDAKTKKDVKIIIINGLFAGLLLKIII